jgi:hypothetical protein
MQAVQVIIYHKYRKDNRTSTSIKKEKQWSSLPWKTNHFITIHFIIFQINFDMNLTLLNTLKHKIQIIINQLIIKTLDSGALI